VDVNVAARKEFRPKTAQNENPIGLDRLDASTEQLKRTGIAPVHIGHLYDHRPGKRETENLSNQRSDRELSLPLWRHSC
jgi:hypothetical protein